MRSRKSRRSRPTSSNSCGIRPFGTTTSWLNFSAATILSDSDISRRTRHSSCALRLVSRAQDLGRAGVAARLLDPRRLLLDRRGDAVHFEQQQRRRAFRRQRAHAEVLRDRLERFAVDQLERRRHDARARDVDHRRDRRLDARERRAQRRLERRPRNQPQDDLRDDRQRAFGADQQLRQVVADDVLDGLAAGPDDLAGRQHRLEAEHVALGRAVLEGARPAGALRDVAAERAEPQRRRIGRIEQADLLDRVLQIAGDDVRLDDRQQVGFVDLEDAVHPLEREHDAAVRRDRAAGVAGAGAARHQRNAVRRCRAARSPPPARCPPDRPRRRPARRASARRCRRRSATSSSVVRCSAPTIARSASRTCRELEATGVDQAFTGSLARAAARAALASSARTNSRILAVPRFRSAIDVAYDSRMNPGASNASPGVIATRASSSSACASSDGRADAVGRQEVADVREQVERARRLDDADARLGGQPLADLIAPPAVFVQHLGDAVLRSEQSGLRPPAA